MSNYLTVYLFACLSFVSLLVYGLSFCPDIQYVFSLIQMPSCHTMCAEPEAKQNPVGDLSQRWVLISSACPLDATPIVPP